MTQPSITDSVHIVVDMLYDFIDGSLACMNAENAVKHSVAHIQETPGQKVLYVCDCHPSNHCSFKENGGIWPVHCVGGTRGGAIHDAYYKISEIGNRPNPANTFMKGCNRMQEQYSGYEAVNNCGVAIYDEAEKICGNKSVTISGIATEFCIKATILDFLKHGFKVTLLKDALAYVGHQGHIATLEELERAGVKIV